MNTAEDIRNEADGSIASIEFGCSDMSVLYPSEEESWPFGEDAYFVLQVTLKCDDKKQLKIAAMLPHGYVTVDETQLPVVCSADTKYHTSAHNLLMSFPEYYNSFCNSLKERIQDLADKQKEEEIKGESQIE